MSKYVAIFAVLLLAVAPRASAQMSLGEARFSGNGTLSGGYGDDSSNVSGSDHSIYGAGAADFSGFYYNPSFISFNVSPFYNQSRFNSTSQSLTAASGVGATAAIFGGSHFPGSISYSTTFDSSGNFGIPGLANFTTHGNSDALALNWGVKFKDWPSLDIHFSDGGSSYSIYGAEALGTLHEDTFSVGSAYRIDGFNLSGGYQHTDGQAFTPEFLAGQTSEQTDTGTNVFTFSLGHSLPWHGGFSAGASHMNLTEEYTESGATTDYNTSIDTLTSGVNFGPLTHLNVGANAYYTDNLEGSLYNTLLTAGVTAPETQPQEASRDLTLTGNASYVIPAEHLTLHALVERQQQSLGGTTLASLMFNGEATYSNRLWGGQFSGVLGLVRTSVSTSSESLLGLNTSVNYSHPVQRWTLAGGFSYSQDTQTVLVGYTTSGYSYNGSLGRRIRRRSYWGVYASGERSLLTGEPGTANASQAYSTSFSVPHFSINGSYMKSSGNSLLTTTGLVTTPIPVTALPSSDVVLFDGNSYSVGLSSSPVRGLTFTGGYAKALSNTNSAGTISNNNNENMYLMLTHQFRKLVFDAGYSRLVQGFSIAGTPPTQETSVYVGISRWFNFF